MVERREADPTDLEPTVLLATTVALTVLGAVGDPSANISTAQQTAQKIRNSLRRVTGLRFGSRSSLTACSSSLSSKASVPCASLRFIS